MLVHALRSPTGGHRSSREQTNRLLDALDAAGHDLVDLTGPTAARSAANLQSAVEAGSVDRLLVSGGDGLVHLAIQSLAGSDVPIAIDPSGTGNDFAQALALPPATVDSILAEPTAVDLIRTTGRSQSPTWVASIAIAGFPAAINERANGIRFSLGSQIYTLAAALELPRFRRTQMTLVLDGLDTISLDSAMLAIGNTRLFGGGMLACPEAHPNDGFMHLTSIEGVGRRGILAHLAGRHGGTADRPEVLRRRAKSIEITTIGVAIWGDGEPIEHTPLTFEIVPDALLVAGYDNA